MLGVILDNGHLAVNKTDRNPCLQDVGILMMRVTADTSTIFTVLSHFKSLLSQIIFKI